MGCGIDIQDGVPAGGGSSVVLQGAIIPTIVAVTATGTVDDLVLSFTGATVQIGAVPVASWLTRTDSATLGTTLAVLQPGYYSAIVYVPWAAGQNVMSQITYNATAAQRSAAVAEPLDPECFGARAKAATTIESMSVQGLIPVTQADIDAGTNIIRAQVANPLAAGTPPAAAAYAAVAETVCRIFRFGDIAG